MTREEAIEVYHGLLSQKIKEAFEVFAPELKESEDERIRKKIMTPEEKQLLLKDLSARLPYGVEVQYKGNRYDLTEMHKDGRTYLGSHNSIYGDWHCSLEFEDYPKPYLRPMYSMTEEEIKEFQACHCVYQLHPDFQPTMCNLANECNMFDWLIAHHFDFRGLIEKGLALEAPEDMYKTE